MPFKSRDMELQNMSDHDLLIQLHERNSEMKEDLAAVLGKVLSVCDKETKLDKDIALINARCDSHIDFPKQIQDLVTSTATMKKDIEALSLANVETNKAVSHLSDQARIFDFVGKTLMGSNVFKTSVLAIWLAVVGVYWGRVGQYGWHVVGGFLLAVLIIYLTTFLRHRENRASARKLLKL